MRKFDLFHSYGLSSAHIQGPIDGAKSSFTQTVPDFLDQLVSPYLLHKIDRALRKDLRSP